MNAIDISVVIPVYNEEKNLSELFNRLIKTLDALRRPYEIIFINDGSKDGSMAMLHGFHGQRPDIVTVINFNGNYGQHMAIIAGLEKARGTMAITLDADLQNPPEEIAKLVEKIDQGFDVVGGYRVERKDSFGRRICSKLVNWLRERSTGMHMTDQGCMLRAYNRKVYTTITQSQERALFIPALAYSYASNPTEVKVAHSERANGKSSYSYYKLIRLNFDLITGFTLLPLQLFTMMGFIISILSGVLVVHMAARRIFLGPEAEGVFTLFAILFFLVSVAITGIGLIGEYVGRAFVASQDRPRYLIKEVVEATRKNPRILFFGYSEMGYMALGKLIGKGASIVAVFTHDDDPNETQWFHSVEELARANNLPVYKPPSFTDKSWADRITLLMPDLIVSFYYRRLIPQRILNLAPLGAYNMHGSYLPKYRGKAPANWAVLHGESSTGATLHAMVKEPDAGDIIDQEKVLIGPDDLAIDVMKNVQSAAMKILDRQYGALLAGQVRLTPQDHSRATCFGGRTPEHGRIDWTKSAQEVHNLVRAVSRPYPGAFHDFDTARLIIWKTALVTPQVSGDVRPGQIVSCDPLVVSASQGFLEVIDYEWVSIHESEGTFAVPNFENGEHLFYLKSQPVTNSHK